MKNESTRHSGGIRSRWIQSRSRYWAGEDYEARIQALWQMPQASEYDTILIYGDREHFSNVEYFTGYDPRWEETLLILPRGGKPSILVGNEGSAISPSLRWR